MQDTYIRWSSPVPLSIRGMGSAADRALGLTPVLDVEMIRTEAEARAYLAAKYPRTDECSCGVCSGEGLPC